MADRIRPQSSIRNVPQSVWSRFSSQVKGLGPDITQADLLGYFTAQLDGHIATNGIDKMRAIVQSHIEAPADGR